MSFVKKALDNRQLSLTFTVLVLAFGVFALLTMPRREDPKFNVRQGLIVAKYPGASASDVQSEVTSKIENLLFSYEEVNKAKTFSNSRDQLLFIVVELQDFVTDADIFWSKLQHKLNVFRLSDLPPTVVGPVVESDFGDTIAMLIGFKSENRSLEEVSGYMYRLEDELRQLPALSKMKRIGVEEECFYINLNNAQLSQFRIYLPQLILAINGENKSSAQASVTVDGIDLPLKASNRFKTKADLENQIVAVDAEGDILRVKDIAEVTRGTKDSGTEISVNGEQSVLLSLEMQNGFNIVSFGDEVNDILDSFKNKIPDDVDIEVVVNQPNNVSESISSFIREFFIAIIAVIIVIVLLLPLRVAMIATAAIPVTVAFTFTIMSGVDIQLQQVSLAALIVVLGMLVDDAIVIADNYVEKLDEGMAPYEAAWKSAEELKIPMLVAGLTIVGAFAPLLLLSGYVGEFISSLPLTVAIAINASFIVAMVLTPYLCYSFIKKGLKSESNTGIKQRLLNGLESWFRKLIGFSFNNPKLVYFFAGISVALGALLFFQIKQKLFPAAERDQFVIELRAQEGASLDQSSELIKTVETLIKDDDRLVSYVTFVGTSAPRFYYNYAPKTPQSNFAQILVNTTGEDATDSWVLELQPQLRAQYPNLQILAKKMQQGPTIEAPIELRFSGVDRQLVHYYADSIVELIKAKQLANLVTSDNFEPLMVTSLKPKRAYPNKVGVSSSNISRELAVAYEGLPIGKLWEGNTGLDIILRDGNRQEAGFESLESFYVTSPLTGMSYTLAELVEPKIEWESSNLRNRNGVPTETVLVYIDEGILPSEVLKDIKTEIQAVELPESVQLTYGGEDENQRETYTEMMNVMVYSVFIIFIIILLQFKSLNKTIVVLTAILLCVFGAFFGLWISGYPFGFTAFVGLASLIGVSVRNSIILVDYADHLVSKQGIDVKTASKMAAERRIRPIFLTTMAAAVGVTPMIISGSPMWAPLATVLAVGLVFSMVMTLMTIPVMYWRMLEKNSSSAPTNSSVKTIALVLLFLGMGSLTSNAQTLSLEECIARAERDNKDLQLLDLEVSRKRKEIQQINTNKLPTVMLDGGYYWYYNSERTTETEIAVDELPIIGEVPPIPFGAQLTIPESNRFIGVANLGIYQPITPLFTINSGSEVKEVELAELELAYSRASNKIRDGVSKLYYGLSIETAKKVAYTQQLQIINEQLRQVESAIASGELLEVYSLGLKADALDHQTKILKAENDLLEYRMKLNRITGISRDSVWNHGDITVNEVKVSRLLDRIQEDSLYLNNKEYKADVLQQQKAEAAIRYNKNRLIPDLFLTAQGFYTSNVPVIPEFNVFVGATFSWPILQWGKKNLEVEQAELQLLEATLKSEDTRDLISEQIITAANDLKNAKLLHETATKAFEFRAEEFRIQKDAYDNGLLSFNDFAEVQKKYFEAEISLIESKANINIKAISLANLLDDNY